MGGLVRTVLEGISKGKWGLLGFAATAGLALAKEVFSKPGIAAYMEYQVEKIFHGWSEDGPWPTEVDLATDSIIRIFNSKRLLIPESAAAYSSIATAKSSTVKSVDVRKQYWNVLTCVILTGEPIPGKGHESALHNDGS